MTITKRASDAFASLPPISVADLEARVGPVYWFALGFEHPERPLRSEAGQVESVLAVGDYARPRGDSDAWNRVETVSEDRTLVKLSSGWRGDPALLEKQPANRLECDESRNPIIRSGDLVLGKRYRIVEIFRHDRNPSHALGDVLGCAIDGPAIRPERVIHDSWFASDGEEEGTWVTAVQLVEGEPEPNDTGVIRAAEGVVLEPGEYEVVEIAAWDMRPWLGAGSRFSVRNHGFAFARPNGMVSNYGDGWRWEVGVRPGETLVTAVRRIEPVAAPLVEPGERVVPPHATGEVREYCERLRATLADREAFCLRGAELLEQDEKELAELRAKVGELETEVSRAGVQMREALDEELQQIDDAVVAAGGTRDRGPAAFIRDLKAKLAARDSEIARLRERK